MMTETKIKQCRWCSRELTGKVYRPNAKAHRFTVEDLIFCNHSEYAAYVKEERESRVVDGGFDCPANA